MFQGYCVRVRFQGYYSVRVRFKGYCCLLGFGLGLGKVYGIWFPFRVRFQSKFPLGLRVTITFHY